MIDEYFVDLQSCPACYGQSHCNIVIEGESSGGKIRLTGYSKWKFMKYANLKNVFYAVFGEEQVVLKKLAHDSELTEFDEKLCRASKLSRNCNVSQAIKDIVAKAGNDISHIVSHNKELFEDSDAVKCHHNRNIKKLYENFLQNDFGPYHLHHFLTMLAVNMEPLLVMVS